MQQNPELRREQNQVDRCYQALDQKREHYRAAQRQIAAKGASGSPQNRSERDAMSAYYGDQATRLEQVEERLVFGRLHLDSGEDRYIGRIGLTDKEKTQLLIDWRAQAATAFYQATARNRMGVVARRHISLKGRQVSALEDELLDSDRAQESGLNLQGEGALISSLNANRSGHMGDIVATIQREQDQIIRSDTKQILVIQGGPGTGKTAVALHRAAYLLYAKAEQLSKNGVLVVGPSPSFLRYIEQVLPALGESGVVSTTIENILPGITPTVSEPRPVSRLKGDLRWVKVAQRAVKSLQRIPEKTQRLKVNSYTLELTPNLVKSAIRQARLASSTHNQGRDTFVKCCLEQLTDQYLQLDAQHVKSQLRSAQLDRKTKAASPKVHDEDRSWIYEDIRTTPAVRKAINLCWMPYSASGLLAKMWALPGFLAQIAPEFSPRERRLLYRERGCDISAADVPLLDELWEHLGDFDDPRSTSAKQKRRAHEHAEKQLINQAMASMNLGGGIVNAQMIQQRTAAPLASLDLSQIAHQNRDWVYGHVVVDEAQELSPMAWHCLARRCPSRSFTIVGDLAQRASGPAKSWSQLLTALGDQGVTQTQLTICYRTPAQIMALAESVVKAAGYPVPFPVKAARSNPDALSTLPGCRRSKDGLLAADTIFQVVEDERRLLAAGQVDYGTPGRAQASAAGENQDPVITRNPGTSCSGEPTGHNSETYLSEIGKVSRNRVGDYSGSMVGNPSVVGDPTVVDSPNQSADFSPAQIGSAAKQTFTGDNPLGRSNLDACVGRIALIVPRTQLADYRFYLNTYQQQDLQKRLLSYPIPLTDSSTVIGSDPITDQVALIDPDTAKGLEFDTVVLVDPAQMAKESIGNLFVAMTRPTKRLVTLTSGALPAGWIKDDCIVD